MTSVTSSLPATNGSTNGSARHLLRYLSDIFEGIREGLDAQQTYKTLDQLSDSELSRRGLSREDLPTLAVEPRIAA
ncbi:MAG TPA: hypothetical protein VNQ99_05860 [Xanthobacteraceae bacterium]|nr:hypothetical protein [Xanthobacteraceae bacterium]